MGGGKEGVGQMRFRVRVMRRLVAAVMLMGVSVLVWSMFVRTLPEVTRADSPARRLIAESVKHLESTAKERRGSSSKEDFDLNYVSKRRIPCGPDPLHNRRFAMLRVPPSRH